jgi:hypothetical protein
MANQGSLIGEITAADSWLYFHQGELRIGRVSLAGTVEEATQLISPAGGRGLLRVVNRETLLSHEDGAYS